MASCVNSTLNVKRADEKFSSARFTLIEGGVEGVEVFAVQAVLYKA